VQNETQTSLHKKYFMHGTSHHMGLDTHDYGILTEPISQYGFHRRTRNIPAEGFGIRLEDDLVIQESGEPFNLMRNIPIEAG
jgi:Xaa-Pro aminopeptidase